MLLALAVDVLVAWLIAKRLKLWWMWLPTAVVAGVVVSFAHALGLNWLGLITPGQAMVAAISKAPIHAAVCCLYAWWFARRRRDGLH